MVYIYFSCYHRPTPNVCVDKREIEPGTADFFRGEWTNGLLTVARFHLEQCSVVKQVKYQSLRKHNTGSMLYAMH